MPHDKLTVEELREMAEWFGLDFSDERLVAVLPHVRRVQGAIGELQKLDIGVTGPANVFTLDRLHDDS